MPEGIDEDAKSPKSRVLGVSLPVATPEIYMGGHDEKVPKRLLLGRWIQSPFVWYLSRGTPRFNYPLNLFPDFFHSWPSRPPVLGSPVQVVEVLSYSLTLVNTVVTSPRQSPLTRHVPNSVFVSRTPGTSGSDSCLPLWSRPRLGPHPRVTLPGPL